MRNILYTDTMRNLLYTETQSDTSGKKQTSPAKNDNS